MSRQEQLNLYIGQMRHRLQMYATLRGMAAVANVALLVTVVLVLLLNRYAFPERGIGPARLALIAALLIAVGVALALPLLKLNRRRAIERAEQRFPALEQRLVTFSERQQAGDPFIELLAGDTLAVAQDAPVARLTSVALTFAYAGEALLFAGVLGWMVMAAPGYMGYGASLLWRGEKKNVTPIYDIQVSPGDAAVRRNSDELVTAQVVGLEGARVTLHARFGNASTWEPVEMQAQPAGQGFQFIFAALPENVEYYVDAGPVRSKNFHVRVVDLPAVKALQVVYHYPRWTGLQTVSEEHGGDLRALEGTEAELTVTMDAPLKDGMLVLDGGQQVHLTGGDGNRYHGAVRMQKDGAYHVAATDGGQQVRLSEDYFISTEKANSPQIAIDRPGADYRASPIEEVTIGVKAGADFGLHNVTLHYSVNGGPQQSVDVLKQAGARNSTGTTTLRMEDFKLVPGDVVSLYATAKDAHEEAKTEISFIQIDPFEREFSQSQQSGGGGGGGGQGQGNQTDISRREKELIAATWKQQNDKASTAQHAADMGKTLSEAQATLRQQVLALSSRMQSRDLSSANEEFTGFEKDMQAAAAAMIPSAEKLKGEAWADAMPQEQKALQALLRAEATFRQIQVAFGQQGGGGGGGGGSAGRDLASLFDLEMDTEKNQYETAQTGSPAEQQAKKVDDALEKLDALAKRQEELAQQQGNQAQNFQQRWQQEMLRREAEQLQREMEQMQAQRGQQGQQASQGQQGQQGQAQQGSSAGQSASPGGQSSSSQGGASSGQSQQAGSQSSKAGSPSASQSKEGAADPRVAQALERLKEANEEMRRAGAQTPSQNGQRGSEQAKQAAQRLREATNLLGGAQKQQASGKLDSLGREAGRLTREESAQAERIRQLAAAAAGGSSSTQSAAHAQDLQRLIGDRQKLSDDLSRLEKGLRDEARELAGTQPGASAKLRDTLGGMDESELGNRIQRTADGLRTGRNPNTNGNEAAIAAGLKKVEDGVREAQQGMGPGTEGKGRLGQGTETAALDHVDRLRSAIQGLSGRGQTPGQQGGPHQQPGQAQQPGRGQPSGQQASSQGQGGTPQPGSAQRGGGQPGQQSGQSSAGQLGQPGGVQQSGGQGGNQGGAQRSNGGDLGGNRIRNGGGGGVANWNVNTGNNIYDRNARSAPLPTGPNPADSERTINQGIQELNKLRQLTQGDPAAARQVQDLVKEMQALDPGRFKGNPEMVEQLHTQVLNDLDKLELELRRSAGDASAQVRSTKSPPVPPGYQDAVAEYFRRLGKTAQ